MDPAVALMTSQGSHRERWAPFPEATGKRTEPPGPRTAAFPHSRKHVDHGDTEPQAPHYIPTTCHLGMPPPSTAVRTTQEPRARHKTIQQPRGRPLAGMGGTLSLLRRPGCCFPQETLPGHRKVESPQGVGSGMVQPHPGCPTCCGMRVFTHSVGQACFLSHLSAPGSLTRPLNPTLQQGQKVSTHQGRDPQTTPVSPGSCWGCNTSA